MYKFAAVLFLAAIFSVVGCKGPEGPAGPKGDTDTVVVGVSNFEGFKPGLTCQTCHTADYDTTYRVVTREIQYEASGHHELGDYDRNTTQCAGCHTNEGFLERARRGFSTETYIPGVPSGPLVNQDYPNSSPVGCFTCHSPHMRGNFTVRDSSAENIFTIVVGQSTQVWSGTASSSLCVKCHQPRMTSTFLTTPPASWQPNPAKTAATDTAKIYSSRWNNHVSGEETQTLLGFGGFEFAGYSYPSSSHTTAAKAKLLGCENCHMATPIGNKGGGHTFKVAYVPEGSTTTSYNFAGCNAVACHNGAVSTSSVPYWKVRDEIRSKIGILGRMMTDTTITKKWSPLKNGKAVVWANYTIATDGDTTWAAIATTSSPLVIIPAFKAGALWNLQQVQYEQSFGIHNYRYVKALLDASIAELGK